MLGKLAFWKRSDGTAETQEGLVSFVNNEHARREQERLPWELQWRLNIAFIEGRHYLDINPAAQTLQEIPRYYVWQEREVFNQIAPIIETRIARIARLRPILKARPGTNEQRDIRAAKVGSAILKDIYYEQGIQNLMSEVYAWMEACGSVFFKNIWNPEAGPVVGYEVDENGNQVEICEGDLDVIIVPPQEIFPDSNYRQGVENCRSIIHVKLYHVDEIEDIWGVKVKPDEQTAMKLQRSLVGVGGLFGSELHFHSVKMKNYAAVKEYWERPSKKHPQGRLVVICQDKLLHAGELPYPVGQDGKLDLPFVKVDCIERAGVFWGRTVVERLIPVQRRYNALKNRKAEFLNRAAIGQYDVEDGSVDVNDFEANSGAPGHICVYKRGHNAPKIRDQGQLPSTFEQEEANLRQEFNTLSSTSDLSRLSKAPPGVKSGVALSTVMEQDDTRQVSTVSNVETFLTGSGRQWLRMYKHFVKGTRTLKSIGKDNIVELIDWTGSEITSDDVVIEAFSSMVESPAQRRQMIFDLLNTGLLHDDDGRINKNMKSKIFEIIELGNWEAVDNEEQLHISKAQRENLKLSQGMPIEPAYYDDHIRHIYQHHQFRLTVDYEELIEANPLIDQLLTLHENAHLMLMGELAQGQDMPAESPDAGMMGPEITGDNAEAPSEQTGGLINV